jgi:hypothetical protein
VGVHVGMAPDGVMKEPSAAPVYQESHEGEKKHDARLRWGALMQGAKRFRHDERCRRENQDCARHRSHGFGSAQSVGEARSRLADGDPHGQEVCAKRESVGQQVQRIGLENDAVRPDGPKELDDEETADKANDCAEATGLVRLARSEAAAA